MLYKTHCLTIIRKNFLVFLDPWYLYFTNHNFLRCDRLDTCDLISSNLQFGNPCWGINKILTVDYTCELKGEKVGTALSRGAKYLPYHIT